MRKQVRQHAAPVVWALRDFRMRPGLYGPRAFQKVLNGCDDIDAVPFSKVRPSAYADLDTLDSHGLLEINNTCNIDCLMCMTSLSTRPKAKMSKEVLVDVLDRLVELGITSVALHTIGDPLANPRLGDVLKELRSRKIAATISTNGLLLERHLSTLIEYADVCNTIRFSIDGARPETYERIRAGGKWDTLLRNMELARNRLPPKGMVMKVIMVLSSDNRAELGEYIVRFRDYVRYPHADLEFSLVNSLSPDNSYFDRVKLFPNHTHKNEMCPDAAGNRLAVLVNGDTTACCRDYNGELVTGNLLKDDMTEILHGERRRALRQAHEKREVAQYPLCDTCYVEDDRVRRVINDSLQLVIARFPREGADFYQQFADRLIEILASNGPYRPRVEELLLGLPSKS